MSINVTDIAAAVATTIGFVMLVGVFYDFIEMANFGEFNQLLASMVPVVFAIGILISIGISARRGA